MARRSVTPNSAFFNRHILPISLLLALDRSGFERSIIEPDDGCEKSAQSLRTLWNMKTRRDLANRETGRAYQPLTLMGKTPKKLIFFPNLTSSDIG